MTDLAKLRAAHAATGFWQEDAGALAITEAESGRLVGTCQFYRSSPVIHGFEIGYIVHSETDRGKDYASQALAALTELLLEQKPKLFRLQLIIETWNAASCRVAQKCGYRREGVLAKAGYSSDTPEDCYIYSRVRS